MKERRDYYVYAYIDPRNYDIFYIGKGCGGRKDASLNAASGSVKESKISSIRKCGEEPIVRVLARELSESEAFLVEAALIWRSRGKLSNDQKGHHSWRFRPENTMHTKIADFDFYNGFYYVNVSEGPHRSWQDCRKFGFLAAGGGRRWSEQLEKLNAGDVIAAYCAGAGFVGVGLVTRRATNIMNFRFSGRSLKASDFHTPRILENAGDPELAQYVVSIEWKATVPTLAEAKFVRNSGLYTPQRVVASLAAQPNTLRFIEKSFGVSLEELASTEMK